jgi:predicted double-glycine peptidase
MLFVLPNGRIPSRPTLPHVHMYVVLIALQSENKTLQDAEKQNHEGWDAKYEDVLWQLQDIQEEKDNPQAQVVNIEVDELYDL